MMPRRLALFGLVVSTIAIVTAYALAFLPGGANDVSVLLMIFGIAAMAVSLMILGAVRSGEKLGVLAFAFSFVFLVLMVGFAYNFGWLAFALGTMWLDQREHGGDKVAMG